MENLTVIKNFMANNQLKYLLVNSTNKFLVEYNTLQENSRYKITKFSGSTGEALITPKTIYLFVDGRYHIQADLEVNHEIVTVIKLNSTQNQLDEIIKRVPQNEILGIFSQKVSLKNYTKINSQRKTKLLPTDPLDTQETEQNQNQADIEINLSLTGLSVSDKIKEVTKSLNNDEYLYLTDLDEVSYLYNMRNFSQNYSSKIKARAIIKKDSHKLYKCEDFDTLEQDLKGITQTVLIDENSINVYDFNLIKTPKILAATPVCLMKSQKNDNELSHLKEAFRKTDKALSATRDYILNNDNISEFDIAKKLEEEFYKNGAKSLSFKSIIAKDKNSALAHYSKSSKDEIIKDGSLVLIDCGGYFEGGLATDITRVFVKGEPTALQKEIYTLVLKAFLNAYNYTQTHHQRPFSGFKVDEVVQNIFKENNTKEFVFNHGLGHGIGINVHEFPPRLSKHETSKVSIKEGMCFSIEPGLYKEGSFGVRLENSCYYKDNKIHSFVKMNYEKKLIDFSMLSEQEKIWLSEFEVL